MQKVRAKTIKGLSIANVILSGLCIIIFLIGIIVFSALAEYSEPIANSISYSSYGAYTSSYDLTAAHHDWGYSYGSPYSYDFDLDEYGFDTDAEVLALAFQMLVFLMVAGLILQAVSLAAAIIMLINSDKPQKLGMVFGWGIAGAIIAFLSGGVVQTVLFVLAAVFAYKDRQLYQKGLYPLNVAAQGPAPAAAGQPSVAPASTPVYTNAPVGAQPAPAPTTAPVAGATQSAPQVAVKNANPMGSESAQTMQVADELLAPSEVDVVDVETVIQTDGSDSAASNTENN